MSAARRSSVERGDVVLCNLPPYSTEPWLSMGVVLHAALLGRAGISARVVRPIDPPFFVPEAALHASLVTFTLDPPMDERLSAMDRAAREAPGFFEGMVSELLQGGEQVIGLSIFRNNVDVTLHVAKLLKARKSDLIIVIGGPEAIEDPAALRLPWIDCVLGAEAESVMVPLVRALLDGEPARAAGLPNVWLNPDRFGPSAGSSKGLCAEPLPEVPRIDYGPLLPLLAGSKQPTVPLLLNWGCPYSCGFCSNKVTYSRFLQGDVSRVLAEMDAIVEGWTRLFEGSPPSLNLQLSDATTNAIPAQLDALLHGVVERLPRWGMRPSIRGQTLVDTRLTEDRVRLMAEAGFDNTFFGLDGGTDTLRRSLQKPGNLAQVRAAIDVYRRAGKRGLNMGTPVGLPGETDGDARATERFVGEILATGALDSITVLPYVFFLSAQDPAIVRLNKGERRGVLWRADVPGGDPRERARRYMRLVEHIGDRVPVASPIPPYIALPAMLPNEPGLDAWMDRYGRSFDQITPPQDKALAPRAPELEDDGWGPVARMVEASLPFGGWALEGIERRGRERGIVVVLVAGERRAAVSIEPRDPNKRAYLLTRRHALSYLNQWQGLRCTLDEALVRRLAEVVG